jgi:hypothetical protein
MLGAHLLFLFRAAKPSGLRDGMMYTCMSLTMRLARGSWPEHSHSASAGSSCLQGGGRRVRAGPVEASVSLRGGGAPRAGCPGRQAALGQTARGRLTWRVGTS